MANPSGSAVSGSAVQVMPSLEIDAVVGRQ
jgi:hypothetical protein